MTVNIGFKRRIDGDDTQSLDDFRMVGNTLRTDDDMILVTTEVAEYFTALLVGQCDGGCRCEIHHAGIDQFECGILQHFGIHGQMTERPGLKSRHDRVGDRSDTGLEWTQAVGQSAVTDFVLEKIDQVSGDLRGFRIGWQILGRCIHFVSDDDGDDFFRRDRNADCTDTITRRHDADRFGIRKMARTINVMCTFHFKGISQIDFDDHFLGLFGEDFVVADRCRRNDFSGFGNGDRFDNGDINRFDLLSAKLLACFGQMIVNVHDFAAVDGVTQCPVCLEWRTSCQDTGIGQGTVDIISQRSAGQQ